jgi:hypothetical protein
LPACGALHRAREATKSFGFSGAFAEKAKNFISVISVRLFRVSRVEILRHFPVYPVNPV